MAEDNKDYALRSQASTGFMLEPVPFAARDHEYDTMLKMLAATHLTRASLC